MPTYDYQCSECGYSFERFQPITARAIRKCPSCGKRKVRRLLGSGAGVIFRGSGFYQTDYRSKAYRDAAKNDRPASGESKGASQGAKDSGGQADNSNGSSSSDA